MEGKFISLFSLTYAYKASAILEQNNISCKTASAPKGLGKSGCGYGIYTKQEDLNKALFLLKQNGIRIKNLY